METLIQKVGWKKFSIGTIIICFLFLGYVVFSTMQASSPKNVKPKNQESTVVVPTPLDAQITKETGVLPSTSPKAAFNYLAPIGWSSSESYTADGSFTVTMSPNQPIEGINNPSIVFYSTNKKNVSFKTASLPYEQLKFQKTNIVINSTAGIKYKGLKSSTDKRAAQFETGIIIENGRKIFVIKNIYEASRENEEEEKIFTNFINNLYLPIE